MKKMYRKEEGVSPVIATILMVAITVVLAATVYIMVAGMGGGGTNKMIAGLNYEQEKSNPKNGDIWIKVSMSMPSTAAWSKVTVKVIDSSGNDISSSCTINHISYGSDPNTLYDGDEIHITAQDSSGNPIDLSGATITLSISGYSGNAQVTIPS